jgi:hypothetical protein
MIERTPVIAELPLFLKRNIKPTPTPVIGGVRVRPFSEMRSGNLSQAEIKAAVEMAGIAPELDPTWALGHEDLLRQSCAYFASEVIRGPKKAPYKGKFLLGRHHLEWDKLIQQFTRINILAARDHGKSHFWSLAYPIWKAGYNMPGSNGIVFSATDTQAKEFLEIIKLELLENPKLAHLIPYTRDRSWSAKKIRLRDGSIIRAAGFGTKVRGGHPDWCVCDDILNDEDIYSETIRRKNIDYFLSAISGMVHVEDQLVVVGTPMHQADLYHVLRDTENVQELMAGQEDELAKFIYECRDYPCQDAKTGELLFPERYDERSLRLKRIELKSAARFAREFLCQPLSDEASLFPAKLFEGPEVRLPYRLGMGANYWEKKGCLRYTGVDIAMSAETGADAFVIFTVAVDEVGNRWIANIRWGKGWSFTKQIDAIKEEYYLLKPEAIHIEANQMQRVWTDEIVRTTDLPVRKFFTLGIGGAQPQQPWKKGATSVAVNKHHIDRGVPGLRITLEHRKWRIPRGDEYSIEMTDRWMGEMSAMGWIDGKVQSVSEHDDLVMACWMCESAVTMGGSARLDFADTPQEKVKDVLAAPTPAQMGVAQPEHDILVAERTALAAVQERKRVVCPTDAYHNRVRQALREYVRDSLDQGEEARAVHGLNEIKRLDRVHGFRSYDEERLDTKTSAQYGWSPNEGSPTADDLGIS